MGSDNTKDHLKKHMETYYCKILQYSHSRKYSKWSKSILGTKITLDTTGQKIKSSVS